MKKVDFKNKNLAELEGLSNEYRAELARFRFKHSMGQLEKTADLRKLRKNVARALTFARQKALKVNDGQTNKK